MNVRLHALGFGPVLLLCLACASPPPPRESVDASVVGASVRIKELVAYERATYAYFVRLDVDDTSLRGQPILSNYARDGYVFLFNAPPGRYALVIAGFVKVRGAPGSVSTYSVNTYVPKATVEKTAVSVRSGEWVFLGDIALERGEQWWGAPASDSADELQRHYRDTLAPGLLERTPRAIAHEVLEDAFGGGADYHVPGRELSLDQSAASLASFMETSRKFAGAEWASALQTPVAAGPPGR